MLGTIGIDREYYSDQDHSAEDRVRHELQTDKALEVLIWHYFDSLLQIFRRLQAERKSHGQGWHVNHFLHFDDGAKFPEMRLGNLELLGPLSLIAVEHQLAGLFLNVTALMNRDNYNLVELDDETRLSIPKAFSTKLRQCRLILGQLCRNQLYANFQVEKVDFEEDNGLDRLSLHLKVKQVDELAAYVASFANRAKASFGELPDFGCLRRDQPHLAHFIRIARRAPQCDSQRSLPQYLIRSLVHRPRETPGVQDPRRGEDRDQPARSDPWALRRHRH